MGGKKAAKRGSGPKTPVTASTHTITPGPIVPNLRQPPQIIADTLLAQLEKHRDKGKAVADTIHSLSIEDSLPAEFCCKKCSELLGYCACIDAPHSMPCDSCIQHPKADCVACGARIPIGDPR